MKLPLYVIILLGVIGNAAAQSDLAPPFRRGSLLVKWTPLSLLDPESTVQFGGEYFITDRVASQVEVGYGPPFLSYRRWSSLDDRQAWRFRTEFRLYRRRNPQKGRYWAIEGFSTSVNGKNSVYVPIINGGSDSYQSFPVQKRVVGGLLKAGVQRAFGRSRHFYYDLYVGLGIRCVRIYADSINGIRYVHPVGGIYDDLYKPRTGHPVLPSAALGIKLAYRFR